VILKLFGLRIFILFKLIEDKSTEIETRLVVARDWGRSERRVTALMGMEFPLGVEKAF
jgi:hypothetical protein